MGEGNGTMGVSNGRLKFTIDPTINIVVLINSIILIASIVAGLIITKDKFLRLSTQVEAAITRVEIVEMVKTSKEIHDALREQIALQRLDAAELRTEVNELRSQMVLRGR